MRLSALLHMPAGVHANADQWASAGFENVSRYYYCWTGSSVSDKGDDNSNDRRRGDNRRGLFF